MQETLLQALRRATAQRHVEVEKLLRLDTPFSLTHYARVLRGFDSFHSGWEPQVTKAFPTQRRPWLASRSRHAMLRGDLAALGLSGGDTPPLDLRLADESAAFGSLYVMEGSALGGQVVARQAAVQHGLGADTGVSYFCGWGPRTGAMWREFQGVLERHDADGADHAAACEAAVRTFDAIAHHCGRSLRGH